MPDLELQTATEQSAQRIEDALREEFGALLTQSDLARLLRYPSVQAVRKARARGNLAIPMFQLPMRRGWFTTTRAVAEFLVSLERLRQEDPPLTSVQRETPATAAEAPEQESKPMS